MSHQTRTMTLADALFVIQRMRASDRACLAALQPKMTDEEFAIDRLHTTWHWTITDKEIPVAIGGVNIHPSGTAVAWIVGTDQIPAITKTLVRFCHKFAAALFDQQAAHRIEGYVLAGVPDCERFARFFGLEFEGTRRKAGANGEDILMYGKVA